MQAASTQEAVEQQQPAAVTATQFLRPHLLKLAAYTPIEPFEILSAKYGRRPEDIVKLDANENPYGPPPEVREALANMPFPHIYPDPETRRLRQALAEWNDIPMEHLLVSSRQLLVWTSHVLVLESCSSSELCSSAPSAFCSMAVALQQLWSAPCRYQTLYRRYMATMPFSSQEHVVPPGSNTWRVGRLEIHR